MGIMARSSRLFVGLIVGAVCLCAVQFLAFVGAPAQPRIRAGVQLHARGGGEYDITDADIQKFYEETITGSGGPPPKGSVVGELIVKAFYGELKPTGFERYSGMWKGPPPGAIGKRDTAVAMDKLKAFMKETPAAMITKGGFGPGALDDQKVADDGKGWVWLAADMSPGGLPCRCTRACHMASVQSWSRRKATLTSCLRRWIGASWTSASTPPWEVRTSSSAKCILNSEVPASHQDYGKGNDRTILWRFCLYRASRYCNMVPGILRGHSQCHS